MHIAFGERTECKEERNHERLGLKKEMASREMEREKEIGGIVKEEEKWSWELRQLFRLERHTNPPVQTPADFYFPCICYQPCVLYLGPIMVR